MAEVSYPETVQYIRDFVGALIKSRNQFNRAFEALKSLSLVIARGSIERENRYDLHPLVRNFIRTEYPERQDRLPYIQPILLSFSRFFKGLTEPSKDAALEELQRWTAKAELEIESGDSKAAVETLARTADKLIARGFHEEFFRVALSIFGQLGWENIEVQDLPKFHDLVAETIKTLAEHKREDRAREYLDRYDGITQQGTVSRVRYYKVACYLEWTLGNFETAIHLGREGLRLTEEANIDTDIDTRHELALALRDHGDWDEALKIFAPDLTVEEIVATEWNDPGRSASFYGNVGRCLQFKSDFKNALHCYVISAHQLRATSSSVDVLNRGYAALWIGEVLELLGDTESSYRFYKQSVMIWSWRAPLKVSIPQQRLERIANSVSETSLRLATDEIDRFCKNWVENWILKNITTRRKSH